MKQMGWGTTLALTLPSRGPAPGQRQTGAEADLAHCVTEIIKMGKMIKDGQSTKADRAPNPSPAQLSAELGTVGEEAGEKILSFNASASASISAMKSHKAAGHKAISFVPWKQKWSRTVGQI